MPADERAQVAADLLASLDDERDDADAVATAWAEEVKRRARKTLRNPSPAEDWDRVRERIAGQPTNG